MNIFKNTHRYLLLILLIVLPCSLYARADQLVGIWLTKDGRSQIKIYKKNDGKYYGKIAWIRDKEERDKKDKNNPDASLRSRNILGLEIIKEFEYNAGEKEWSGGKVYDPESGNFYEAYMWFEEDNNTLYLKGYIMGMRWLGRKETWTREQRIRK
ncbi:MAG: DUF2147 domain-containing protein [Bacteroidota bacterium]